ncbi:ABC transporter ATP-binding protein/permease [Isoptericola sp. NEAU-Y5]|uniref:ABC transporter ATP-binding protein/permease n=1 Tax=Isoptericola luteus TaxID=2879484 RepID=A0ABS7ZGV4_9MICO|nr:ABC transporter ATP-binding protein [Isoptericola sp. NEAU-Y5]MCA5893541.1 ABC transporter ATP-binding protein/permease [Isoptericola sp. NEAU-Y5]
MTDERTTAALQGSRWRRSVALMWRGLRAEPRLYVLAVGSSAVFGALTVAVSRAVGWATDTVVVPAIGGDVEAQDRLWQAGLVLAAVAVTLALSVAGRRIWAGLGFAALQARHRRGVTAQYLRLPMSWHRAHPAGQLLSNASADVEAATGVFNPLPFALGVVVMIGVAAGMLLSIDLWLAAAALVVIPAAVVVNLVFQRFMAPAATRAQQLRAEVADVAHESFEGALLVKSLGTADREEARFADRAHALQAANVRVGVVRAFFDPVIELLPSLGTLVVLGVGTWRASTGAVEAGDVITAAYLLTVMAVPVRAFGWVLGELPRALVGYERIARVLDARGVLPSGSRALPRTAGGLAVRLDGVGVDVPAAGGTARLLDDVDLEVGPGQTVAVVGSTGAGKTTLVSLLARLSDPTRGRVLLDGLDLRDLLDGEVPAQVALVAQQTFVFEDTVRANVTLADVPDVPDGADVPDDAAVWDALRTARLDDLVQGLPGGLDASLGERGANLSGGQRQRLAIARALVRRPRLLVLDDATSAVDPQVESEILRALRGTAGDGSAVTVVMVAYRMSSVALADVVVHLEGGRVVDVGTHRELLGRDPGYRSLATAYEQETARRARERADELAVGDETEATAPDAPVAATPKGRTR